MNDWTKNIPENGILCLDTTFFNYHVIHRCDGKRCFDSIGNYFANKDFLRPLTSQEWWYFAPWQSMDSAPKDENLIMVKDHKNNIRVTKWDIDYECWMYKNCEFNDPIGWLPLPE